MVCSPVFSSLYHYRNWLFKLTSSSPEMISRLLPMLLVAAILVFIDWYFFQGFKSVIKTLPSPTKSIVQAVYWGVAVLTVGFIFTVFLLGTPQPKGGSLSNWLFVAVVAIYLSKILMLPFLLIDDISRLIQFIASFFGQNTTKETGGISRSAFFSKMATYGAAVPLLGFGTGIAFGAHNYQVRKQKLVLPKLPQAFEGLKIVQISDIHSGSFWNKAAVIKGIELINLLFVPYIHETLSAKNIFIKTTNKVNK